MRVVSMSTCWAEYFIDRYHHVPCGGVVGCVWWCGVVWLCGVVGCGACN